MRSYEDFRMDQPRPSSSKRAAARALQLNMHMYYLLRGPHRSGVVRKDTGQGVGYFGNAKAKQKKHKGRLFTVIDSLWNKLSGEGTSCGDGCEVVQRPFKRGKALGTLRWQWKKTSTG